MADSLFAQEITLNGVGPINHSLAGTAVALPRDSAGAIQWNPATISFLEHSEFQLGMGRHNATWYGDEYVAGTVAIGALAALWLYAALSDDNKDSYAKERERQRLNEEGYIVLNSGSLWIIVHDSSPDYSRPPKAQRQASSSASAPKPAVIRVPTISYLYQNPDSRWSFGLAVSEYGAKKIGALAIGNMVGICEYRFQGYEFIPTFAYRESRRLSFGLSPIFSIGGC
jgi:long-subunit fatty acid transport protein